MKETQAFIRKLKAESNLSNYDTVRAIISAMTSSEVRFARSYLMLLHNSEFESQSLRLFRYILQHPGQGEAEARDGFAPEGAANFDTIVSTLKKRLGWSLVSEYNTQREGAYSTKWKLTFEVMNNLMIYHVLIARGLAGHAFDLLNDTIRTAKDIEAYRELRNALELKIRHIRLRSENRRITSITKELEHYAYCDEALSEAKKIYDETGTVTRKLGNDTDELIRYHEQCLVRLQELSEKTGSDSIRYYYLTTEAATCQLKRDYAAAGKAFAKLYDLVERSPVLNRRRNICYVCFNTAHNYLLQGDYEVAKVYCKKAKSNVQEGAYNYFQIEFIEFYIYFYTNQFFIAEKKIEGILSHPAYNESEFLVNTKKYLLACALFAQQKYQETLALLLSLEKVWSDTTGWNVGIRITIMLCYKMLSNYELMAIERERFRALFDKYRHRTSISNRDKIILKIIHEFLKRNSDFKSIFLRKTELFDELKKPENSWQSMSHEMIVFDQWFICMMNKSKYRMDF